MCDSLIAATAIELDLPLFTYNIKDFRYISGIRLYEKKFNSKDGTVMIFMIKNLGKSKKGN